MSNVQFYFDFVERNYSILIRMKFYLVQISSFVLCLCYFLFWYGLGKGVCRRKMNTNFMCNDKIKNVVGAALFYCVFLAISWFFFFIFSFWKSLILHSLCVHIFSLWRSVCDSNGILCILWSWGWEQKNNHRWYCDDDDATKQKQIINKSAKIVAEN